MLKRSRVGHLFSASISKIVIHLPFHPNLYTFLSIFFAILGMVLSFKSLIITFIFFSLSFLMDVTDGAAARVNGASSMKGAFNDGLADRIVETIVIITLAFLDMPPLVFPSKVWLMIILAFGTYMPSFIKAYAVHHGVIKRKIAEEIPGLMERGERCLVFLAIYLLMILNQSFYATLLLFIMGILAIMTSLQRYIYIVRKS